MKKLAITLALLIFVGPSPALLAVGLLMTPAAQAAACLPGSLTVGAIPDELTATAADGTSITLTRTQLTHAATIITVGGRTSGVGAPGVVIALMAALTESRLRMLANTGAYPESGNYPNDGDASDHDSLGLFQMRPAAGWGTVAELMNPTYQAKAFYGGEQGPNFPSPRGLLDIPGWQQMDPGSAAQAVEVSAFPDRYRNWQPVAEAILTALTKPAPAAAGTVAGRCRRPAASCSRFPRARTRTRIASAGAPTPSPASGSFTPAPTSPPPTAPRSTRSPTAA